MKAIGRFCLLPCLVSWLACAAAVAETGEQYSFSFDNGAGLYGSSTFYQFNSRHGDFYPYNGTPVSRFFINQQYGPGALHYGTTQSDDEHHYYGGVSLGPATLAYFQGGAESFSRAPNNLYEDLDQYHFHGGTRSSFDFQGMAADVAVAGGVSTQLAATRVTAPGVEHRYGYYAGVANGRFQAGVFQLDRGEDKVGQGLKLGLDGGRLDVGYQEIQSEYGAHVRRVAFEWSASSTQSFTIELEEARNDLYSGDDDQRVMFTFRKALGRSPAFSAAEEGESDAEKQNGGFGKAVGIGVGLGVAAIAISSGDDDNDGAQRFSVRNNAARDVLNDINPVSVRQNREHGGWIYRNADNTFGYTNPVAGTVSTINIGNPATSVPMGTTASASYHTHGGPDPRFDNENFSPQDLLSDRLARTDGYLGTPAGFMKLHDFETGSVRVLGRINN